MKKLLSSVLACAFVAGALAGCGSPCEKAFDKYAKCMEEKKVDKERIEKFKSKKSKFVEDCKKEGDTSKIKACLDKPCSEYRKCIKNANK
jgi:hypothetical protein